MENKQEKSQEDMVKEAVEEAKKSATEAKEAETDTDETMKIAAAGAEKLGMKPYYLYRQKNMSGNFENTGYARPGKYGLYNILLSLIHI